MSTDRKVNQTVIWTNDFHGTRVFGTTIGHFHHTVRVPEFLDLLARGTLQDYGLPAAELQVPAAESHEGR